jgi:DNA mismatch repair protein MutS
MNFETDKQTTNDLELFEKSKGDNSIFSLFNLTKSIGGKHELQRIFSEPFSDIDEIENRIELIRFFQNPLPVLEIDRNFLDLIEHYLTRQITLSSFSYYQSYSNALKNVFWPTNEYYILQRGVKNLIKTVNELYSFALIVSSQQIPDTVNNFMKTILETIENSSLKIVLNLKNKDKFYPHEYTSLNTIFRRNEISGVRKLLQTVYKIDVYTSIVAASKNLGFTFPTFTKESNYVEAKEFFHPFIENPVVNDFDLTSVKRVCFITGPNMAGKSTFLKTLGISIYLSHLGFPVPARSFKTSVFNGLFTTINLPDNLSNGYSHYYNEVLRVKYVAEQINRGGNFFVVFDELFRGTNIKDAYDASLAVIEAFSNLNKSVFTLSTHIIEVGDKLKENPAIFFKYFEANLIEGVPQYNYQIKDGVTNERIGMYILNKEKVLETINKINDCAVSKREGLV